MLTALIIPASNTISSRPAPDAGAMEVCSDGVCCECEPMEESMAPPAAPTPRKMSVILPERPKNMADVISNMQKSITNIRKSPWLLSRSKDSRSHFESINDLLRSEDRISVVVRLENGCSTSMSFRYLAVISNAASRNDDNHEECVLLGIDVTQRHVNTEVDGVTTVAAENVATVGLVLPITSDFIISLEGDGGFTVTTRERQSPYLFKPTSVQAMWSALQCLGHRVLCERALGRCSVNDERFAWTSFYRSPAVASSTELTEIWIRMPDIESSKEDRRHSNVPPEKRKIIEKIRRRIKDIMMKAEDLDEVTSKYIREKLEAEMEMPLTEYKQLINEEMLVVMRQMDSPSKIFGYLFLGSEWNASNLDELQRNRVGSIVNVTVEIDNFFPGMFHYLNVRVNDDEQTELMKHWQQTYDFISAARKKNSKVLVHCKMGVSRSASTVIAFAMKEYGWSLEKTLQYIQKRRPCVKPNPGFMKQLFVYEGILNAHRFHPTKMLRCRSCSADNLENMVGPDDEDEEFQEEIPESPDDTDAANLPLSVKGSKENIIEAEPPPLEKDEEPPREEKPPPAIRPCFMLMMCRENLAQDSDVDMETRKCRTRMSRRASLGLALRPVQRSMSWPRQRVKSSEATSSSSAGVNNGSVADYKVFMQQTTPSPQHREGLRFLGPQSPPIEEDRSTPPPTVTPRHKSLGMMPRGVTICH